MHKINYHMINVNLTCSVSEAPMEEVPCRGCTKCCETLSPMLTPDEVASGMYPLSLIDPTVEERQQIDGIGPVIALYRRLDGSCSMYVDGKCSIYEQRPRACRQFDCRKGHSPKLMEHAKAHFSQENS